MQFYRIVIRAEPVVMYGIEAVPQKVIRAAGDWESNLRILGPEGLRFIDETEQDREITKIDPPLEEAYLMEKGWFFYEGPSPHYKYHYILGEWFDNAKGGAGGFYEKTEALIIQQVREIEQQKMKERE